METPVAPASEQRPSLSQPRPVSVEAAAAGGEFTLVPSVPSGVRGQRRRRRRRQKLQIRGAAGATVASESAPVAKGDQPQRPWRGRGPRRRSGRNGSRDEGGQAGAGAIRNDQDREAGQRDDQNPERRRRHGERRPRSGKGQPFGGKGRDRGRRDQSPPKLYNLESVVDRGFEDVAAEGGAEGANEGQTRRVDWTILKRTVADQRTAKAVSALYVLKRDGAETEFPNLGAARAAVNKVIVHPEKLTRPKADYPTTKK